MHHVEYLFAFTAFKTGLMTNDQFVMAMTHWLKDKSQPVSEIVQQLGVLAEDEIALIDGLVARQLAKQGGNAQKCLDQLSSLGDVESQLISLNDSEMTHRIQSLRQSHEESDTKSPIRFRRLRSHAKGALGEVFIAEDSELKRKVALKEIQDKAIGEKSAISRFVREAEVTGQLEHPGIVPVYGLGFYDDGRPFYAMKFIKGESLHAAIRQFHDSAEARCPFDLQNETFRKLIQRLIDVCNAVHYAHSKGVLHRDLKPDNVMIGKYGETLVVDWGLARVTGQVDSKLESEGEVVSSEEFQIETKAGSLLGTPQYMSPEQAQGNLDKLNETSDVYSLGATLYVLLTGKSPLGNVGSLKHFLDRVTKGDIRPCREANSNVPQALASVCRKAMSLKQSERYQSAEELGEDLERWLADQPVIAMRESLPMRVRRWTRQHSSLTTAAVVFLMTSIIALGGGLYAVNEQREIADQQRVRAIKGEKLAKQKEREAQENAKEAEANAKKAEIAAAEANRAKNKTADALKEKERALKEKEEAANEAKVAATLAQHAQMKAEEEEKKTREALKLEALAAKKAKEEQKKAEAAQKEAVRQEALAKMAQQKAELARKEAETAANQAQKALDAESKANEQTIAANKKLKLQLQVTNALRLAATADSIRVDEPVTSLLLAREACLATSGPIPEAENSLRNALEHNPSLVLQPNNPLDGVTFVFGKIRFSQDGNTMLTDGVGNRGLSVWDLTAGNPQEAVTYLDLGSRSGQRIRLENFELTPDGNRVIGLTYEGKAIQWNLKSEDFHTSAKSFPGRAIGISPDGKYLATWDEFTKVWDLSARDFVLPKLSLPENDVPAAIAISSDGSVVATRHNGAVRIWDVQKRKGKLRDELAIGKVHTNLMAMTPDGRTLVTVGSDKIIHVWDLTKSDIDSSMRTLTGHQENIDELSISSDGSRIVSSDSISLRIWNATKPDPNLGVHVEYGESFKGSPLISKDGVWLALANWHGETLLWNLKGDVSKMYTTKITLRGHSPHFPMLAVGFSKDSRTLVTASIDKTARFWHLPSDVVSPFSVPLYSPRVAESISRSPANSAESVVVSHSGQRLFAGDKEGAIRIWDLENGAPKSHIHTLTDHQDEIRALLLTPDDKKLISTSSDGTMRLWDLTNEISKTDSTVIHSFRGSLVTPKLSTNGKWMLSVESNGTYWHWRFSENGWEKNNGQLVGHKGDIRSFEFTPDGKFAVTVGEDKTIRLWDMSWTNRKTESYVLGTKPDDGPKFGSSLNGNRFFVTGAEYHNNTTEEKTLVWDLSSIKLDANGNILKVDAPLILPYYCEALAFLEDDRILFAVQREGTLEVWSYSAGEPHFRKTAELPMQSSYDLFVDYCLFSSDGKRLIISGQGVRMWNLDNLGGRSKPIEIGNRSLYWKFNPVANTIPSKKFLVSVDDNGLVRVWDLDVGPLIDYARTLAGRELTDEERKRYRVPERVNNRPYKRTTRTYGFRLPFMKE